MATTGQVGAFTLSSPFSSTSPATPASQLDRFSQITGALVAGTVAVTQAIKQPTVMYPPAIAGTVPGAALGSSQLNTNAAPGSSISMWALGGAALALVAALVFVVAKR